MTPKTVYDFLKQENVQEEELRRMENEFYMDNHSMWSEQLTPKSMQERNRRWKEDSEKMQTEIETLGKSSRTK